MFENISKNIVNSNYRKMSAELLSFEIKNLLKILNLVY